MKGITVNIERSKHASQAWTFAIDRPGPAQKETKRERYATPWSAKRGARRMLGESNLSMVDGALVYTNPKTAKQLPVVFVVHK
jgi:hypothetical protein